MAELSGAEWIVQERLKKLGATLTKMHFTGDNSFPTEYRIETGDWTVVEPTLELALMEFIERQQKEIKSLKHWQKTFEPVVNAWSARQPSPGSD
jgi:hypothetical protein